MILYVDDGPEFKAITRRFDGGDAIAGIYLEDGYCVWIDREGKKHKYIACTYAEFVRKHPDGPDALFYELVRRKYPEMLL